MDLVANDAADVHAVVMEVALADHPGVTVGDILEAEETILTEPPIREDNHRDRSIRSLRVVW